MRAMPCKLAVEEGAVRDSQRARQRRLIDGETVVLTRNQYPARMELGYRVIGAVVSELHLDRLRAAREAQELMAEADTEDGDFSFQVAADGRDGIVHRFRIARTIT